MAWVVLLFAAAALAVVAIWLRGRHTGRLRTPVPNESRPPNAGALDNREESFAIRKRGGGQCSEDGAASADNAACASDQPLDEPSIALAANNGRLLAISVEEVSAHLEVHGDTSSAIDPTREPVGAPATPPANGAGLADARPEEGESESPSPAAGPAEPEVVLASDATATATDELEPQRPQVEVAVLPATVEAAEVGGAGLNGSSNEAVSTQHAGESEEPVADVPDTLEDPAPAARYRPATRGSTSTPRPKRARPRTPRESDTPKLLSLAVRLVRQRGGFCRVTLVPARVAAIGDSPAVHGVGSPTELSPLQENWYSDVEPTQLPELLQSGVAWESRGVQAMNARWALGGRDVFALSVHDELHGYVNTRRLTIGEDHVVLCTTERLSEVEALLSAAGASANARLEWEADGANRWVVLDGVQPSRPLSQGPDGDVLNVLRPLADAELVFRGGIRLTRSTYLQGFPPQIRLLGDAASAGQVLLDGTSADVNANGVFTAPGWDSLGDHIVSCSTGTKSYRIEEGTESWEPWDAYTWSDGESSLEIASRPSICGLLVRPPREETRAGKVITVPLTNPVLIGSRPGELYTCSGRPDLRGRTSSGYPPFDPVWALPSDPLHTDKTYAKVLQLGNGPVELSHVPVAGREGRRSTELWISLLLDARRKGLSLDSMDPGSLALWRSYCAAARFLGRRIR